MSLRSWWTFLGAWWPEDETDAGLPALGSGAGYVPTLQADNTVVWTPGGSVGELLVEDGAMELEFDDATGDVLYEG